MRETSLRYHAPFRPGPVRIANRALGLLGSPGRLEVRPLFKEASRRVGYADFGSAPLEEPLAHLCESLKTEARLTPLGRLLVRERLLGLLTARLRVERALLRRPDVRALPLSPLTLIVGLQRTGTTLLHRLLTADPQRRWLASWESLNPVPIAPDAPLTASPERRIRAARLAEKTLAYLAPDFFAVHPVDATEAEEDVLLLDHTLLSTVSEATLRVPRFSRWLEEQDQRPAYRYMALLLRLLSAQRGTRAWVLKSPHHLEWLDVILEMFPDTRVIWTHRDPAVAVPSFCSMVAHGRGVFSDAVDPREVGEEWLRKTARLVSRALHARAAHEGRFIDVHYADLVADPVAEVRRVHAALGDRFDPETERRVRAKLAAHPQHKYGRHRYEPASFGLDASRVHVAFPEYMARFLAPRR
ncbi:MAG: sulfotransferase [Sandaracinaceae bacterium]